MNLYGDQLKKPNVTLIQCAKFDNYFDQQLQELENTGSKTDSKDLRKFHDETLSDEGDMPPPLPGVVRGGRVPSSINTSKHGDSDFDTSPNASRPTTPAVAGSHLLVAKAGPGGKMSRRARKLQNTNSAPASSGDEASAKRAKAKAAKKGRKWDADGFADEEDDVQLDFSASKGASDSEGEVRRGPAIEEVDASTWGSTTKGKFVLRDLGDEVHSILASAEAKNSASKTDAPTGLVGTGLSAIGGLFRNVVGGKVLTKEDLDKAMKGMEEHLLKKNVAREAAVRLCEGVEKELIGVKTGSFESESGF